MKRPIHRRIMDSKMIPKPMEYWFDDEFKGKNNFGKDLDTITKCWTFELKYWALLKDYYEFQDWEWANKAKTYGMSNGMVSFEKKDKGHYVFVYRIYHLNLGEIPLGYDKKHIHDSLNPYPFQYGDDDDVPLSFIIKKIKKKQIKKSDIKL